MAIGWLSVLKMVPWVDVISNAPKVAEGAKKLWDSVGRKQHLPKAASTAKTGADVVVPIDSRLMAAESTLALLQEQMLASAELIKELAEQNRQLVARVDLMRRRMAWIGLVTALLVVGLIVSSAAMRGVVA
ncbi:hypothetical protein [Actimicrobium antarcticum]|uniref:Uncharacterized protein n=1 Tax=Actimicrobium antarcticum TaxID=1051899 RepID=A0ABP7SHF5_9BURK